MDITKNEISFPSVDKSHTLKGDIYLPGGEVKGVFHIVHGMTEHIGRYEGLMLFLAENGYVAVGYDNLGHGRTANEGELGFIAEKNGVRYLVRDVIEFSRHIKKQYSSVPYFLMGHSMGSFIVRLAAAEPDADFNRLVICGTAGPNPLSPFGFVLADVLIALRGKRGNSMPIEALAFGTYNKRFEKRTSHDWLTKDRVIIDNYKKDKYCNYHFKLGAMRDLLSLQYNCNLKKAFNSAKKDMPIFIVSGGDDPVGNYGKGVEEVFKRYKRFGSTDVKMKLYDGCRHEIHGDTCKEEMFADILDFIG